MIMHIELAILGDHVIMATDAPEAMGFNIKYGNNMTINLEPDTRAETERLFKRLNENGEIEMPLSDMFWGTYFGIVVDQFGVRWMLNFENKR
jgi:PhnB protein